MTYGYVCISYNNAHFTVTAVESLMAGDVPPARIVIVDNASATAEVVALEALAARFAVVDLVLNRENVGYFPGLNIGIGRLRALLPDFDAAIIGNNDLEFPPEFGRTLEERLPTLAAYPVIAPNVVTLEGEHQNPHILEGFSPLREFIYDVYYSSYPMAFVISKLANWTRLFSARKDAVGHERAGFIRTGIGACYILTRTFFESFEGLWAPTFLMGEEYYLTRQLEERGMRTYYDPALLVRHRSNALRSLSGRRIWQFAREGHRVRRRYMKGWGFGLSRSRP